jgi:hypothetical protein
LAIGRAHLYSPRGGERLFGIRLLLLLLSLQLVVLLLQQASGRKARKEAAGSVGVVISPGDEAGCRRRPWQ